VTAGAVVALAAGVWGAAHAQETAPGTPPSWDTLVKCAQMANEDARLSCYDAAMRAAGYAPKPAEVAAEKRKRFGLSIPQVSILKHKGEEEGSQAAGEAQPTAKPGKHAKLAEETEDEVMVEIAQVATVQPNNQLLLFTSDGQIWQQTDSDPVQPYPKAGDSIRIHKGTLGGYLCDVNKYKTVRCKRER
jgi:hypothetical protein